MARPAYIQTLEKGKLLTGASFPEFVNTWNFLVNRVQSIKGDRDANPQDGHITVDEADPEHPVIRYVPGAVATEGVSDTFPLVTSIEWDSSGYRIVAKGKRFKFEKGLLTEVSEEEEELGEIETTPWTGE